MAFTEPSKDAGKNMKQQVNPLADGALGHMM
jgi:hypothetical protein